MQKIKAVNYADFVGQKIGRLSLLDFKMGTRKIPPRMFCRCDCGKEKWVKAHDVCVSGVTVSCGCFLAELRKKPKPEKRKHGMCNQSIYYTWNNIISRCYKPSHKSYKNYGARGIHVSEDWKDFQNFYRDMGDKPSKKHSVERIDNDGPYSKENCRWATPKEQMQNTRASVYFDFDGQRLTLSQILEKTNSPVPYKTAHHRLKSGWSLDRAISKNPREYHDLGIK